jgi:NAD(P) transhydrogenase subunit beta
VAARGYYARAGGFGNEGSVADTADYGEHTEITAEETAELLKGATSVVITPGYGMAVAQAQTAVADLTRRLRDRGVDVRFGIHPVAGRLPGHMNVLLAEAKVPYDVVVFKRTMSTGYAGVQNPLFFRDNTKMLFGDARERVDDILRSV